MLNKTDTVLTQCVCVIYNTMYYIALCVRYGYVQCMPYTVW